MRNSVRISVVALLALPWLAAGPVRADAFRCGSSIVREGLTAMEIEDRCGKADLIRTREEPVYSRLENGASVQVGTSTTHFWFYERGPNQYVAKITIRDSLAEKIDLLEVTALEDLKEEDLR